MSVIVSHAESHRVICLACGEAEAPGGLILGG